MPIDANTMILYGALAFLALVTPLFNVFFRIRKFKANGIAEQKPQALSVIMAVHDNANELERNLPMMLTQKYEPGFEVIVVDESSTDDTEDVLKRLKKDFPCLYTTFIPSSSHYLSRHKLALTIGMKAAHNEWVIITDADCKPNGSNWLTTMARYCNDSHDIVLGYTNYEPSAKQFQRFERLQTFCHIIHSTMSKSAFRYNGNNIALRKSEFMAHNGFLANLKFLRGEYDFIANEYSVPGRTAIAIEADAHIVQDSPSKKKWANEHIFYMETRHQLKHGTTYRLLYNTDTFLLHFNYLVQLAAIIYSSITQNWMLLGCATICLALTIIIRTLVANKALARFGEHIAVWSIPFLEVRIMWQNINFMLRHLVANKNDFIRK